MASKSGSKKKSDSTRSGDADDKDMISELKNRVAVLENELRLKDDKAIRDTTECKLAIEKLAERERLLRNVFECIQDGISVLDKDLNIIQVNPIMEKRYGARIAGKKCYQAYHGRSEPCELCPSVRALKTGSAQMEVVYDLNGWTEVYAFPLVNDRGKVTGVIEHVRDINERMRANNALRDSEEKFRQMAEGIGEVFFIFTQDWKQTVYVSPAYERVWGRPIKDVYGNSMAWLEGVHPDDRGLPLAVVNKHIGGNIPETDTVEFRIVRPDGTVRWILARTYPVMDEHGIVYRITGIAEDITQRKQAEEALQSALLEASRFREAMEHVSAYIFMKDLQSRYTYANKQTLELFGCSAEELVRYGDNRFFPPETVKRLREVDLRVFAGEQTYEEIDVPDTGSGQRVYLEVKTPIYEDLERKKISGLLGISTDITERKQAEEALKLTGYSLDNVRDIVIWFSPDGRIIYANNAACKSFGYSHDEMLSLTIFDINPCYTKESWNDRWQDLKSKGSSHYEDINQDKDGCQFPIDVTNTYIKYGDKELMFGYARNITERKLAEEEIKAAKAQAELYLDLMGHDINNMHQIALGYLELARDMPPGEDQVKFLDKPVEVLQRSTQLIKNVRKLQKLKEGVFRTQKVDVCEVLRDVQRELGAVPKKAITLNMNRCEQCLVRANELLHDVFANLVSNAIKHTGDNTDIVIDMDVLKDKNNKYCRVMIEDNGPGIPDIFKSVIFNRELRGTSEAKGMGLGLFLVKSLVDSYNGQVWVEDRVIGDYTKGARFVVMLPIVEK